MQWWLIVWYMQTNLLLSWFKLYIISNLTPHPSSEKPHFVTVNYICYQESGQISGAFTEMFLINHHWYFGWIKYIHWSNKLFINFVVHSGVFYWYKPLIRITWWSKVMCHLHSNSHEIPWSVFQYVACCTRMYVFFKHRVNFFGHQSAIQDNEWYHLFMYCYDLFCTYYDELFIFGKSFVIPFTHLPGEFWNGRYLTYYRARRVTISLYNGCPCTCGCQGGIQS